MRPSEIIDSFDAFLVERGLTFEAIVVGGAALALLGTITRETRDVDVVVPDVPAEIAEAARAFAAGKTADGLELKADWLNNGPAALAIDLPSGWEARKQLAFSGRALVLHALGRSDLLKSKLWSLCDRVQDLDDCLAMKPTAEELRDALPWVQAQDANPDWPEHVAATLSDLGRRLGHAV